VSQPRAAGYYSRFGGFWPDRVDDAVAPDPTLSDEEAARFAHWRANGWVVLEGAVDRGAIDALNRDVERLWTSGNPRIWVDYFEDHERRTIPVEPRHRDINLKVVDLYGQLESARRVAFAPAILAFLRRLFERDPMAFQSLYFRLGSQQPMHQDTAYVQVHPPMEFVGCWVALEDVRPGSGELEYYSGSHRIQEYLWDGVHKWMPPDHPDHDTYLAFLHEQARARGLRRVQFRPRAGDALVWHADLAHGGAAHIEPGATRRSLVSHFCPVDREPGYFREMRHSEKLLDPSGGYYCYAKRWAPEHDESVATLRRWLGRGRSAAR
jgi:ectoine hydroxylase-related dioxygenase (phytanoyl-CoA dioxygenase family)